jgi:DNA-binding transcriptional ArsR family regulator
VVEERRLVVGEPELMAALAHPVRLRLLEYLMAAGPATASQCARAVGDTPSNCSYHLRTLARHGVVAPDGSADGRERPYRSLVTGFSTEGIDDEPGSPRRAGAAALLAVGVQLEQQSVRDYLARRDQVPSHWRAVETHGSYVLRMTPAELAELGARLDALIRPYIAATRTQAPDGAELVALGLHAYAEEAGR